MSQLLPRAHDGSGAAYFTADVVGYHATGGTVAVFLPARPVTLYVDLAGSFYAYS